MGIINIVKNVKKVHPEHVTFIKVGRFYYTYGKDSFIISYLFNYKLTTVENIFRCGFIENSLKMVLAKLEQHKINYLILDRRNNYEVEDKTEFKTLNNYAKMFEKANKIISLKIRITRISDFLNENIQNQEIKTILKEIENVIDERRKI